MPVPADLVDDIAADAVRTAPGAQLLRVAQAAVSKVIIVPTDDMPGMQLTGQTLGKEGIPGLREHRPVKMGEQNLVDAV